MQMDKKKFQTDLLCWYKINQRPLPWRSTHSPYHIWVSEIMLQQTQMDRGVTYFNNWMERFPDIASVARASEEEILKLWEGLGYYSRARNIQKCARILAEQFACQIPEDHAVLLSLPGIGPYTAGAIMSLAFNRDFPVVDANVERLFSRLYDIATPIKISTAKKFIWQQAHDLIPTGKAREFNQALMELGALVCAPGKPDCPSCPVSGWCKSFTAGTVEQRPIVKPNDETVFIEMATGVLIHHNRLFIQKRPTLGVWANLWEFPGGRLEKGESPEQALIREYREETEFEIGGLKKLTTVKHSYTKYRVTLHCFRCCLTDSSTAPVLHAAQQYKWVYLDQLDTFAFPAGHRKLVDFILGYPASLD